MNSEVAPLLSVEGYPNPNSSSSIPPLHRRDETSRPFSDNSHLNSSSLTGTVDHCHTNNTISRVDKVARRKLIIASILCLFFMIGETVGGALAGSLAIMTDAAHLLTDFASFMISLLAIYLASLPPTKKMSFGWHRAEIIGALISVLLIWVVTGILVYMACLRVISKEYEINAQIMLITSSVGVLVNIIMAATLHQHSHSHASGTPSARQLRTNMNADAMTEEGGSEDPLVTSSVQFSSGEQDSTMREEHSREEESKKENINVRAAFIHVVGDFIQSLGVLTAALVIYFKPNDSYNIADPICTFIFSVLVLLTTLQILRETMHVLMEGVPRGLNFNDVKNRLFQVPGVIEVHNLRMWSLTTTKSAVSAHLAFDPAYNSQQILQEATRVLRETFNVFDVTIQMEPYSTLVNNCEGCRDPIQ